MARTVIGSGLFFGAGLMALPISGTALAQGESSAASVDDSSGPTGEIVVTAQRRDERAQDVPIAIKHSLNKMPRRWTPLVTRCTRRESIGWERKTGP